jgi:tetratricopeptide (TPR) repeat protein
MNGPGRILFWLWMQVRFLWSFVAWHIGFVFFVLWSLIVGAWARSRRWWSERSVRRLILAIPSLLVAGAAVALVIGNRSASARTLRTSYGTRARQAFAENRFEEARICFERLGQKDDSPEIRMGLALSLHHLGKNDRAAALLEQLAPVDGEGFAPAHIWLAAQLLKNAGATAEDLGRAELHLRRALHTQPDSIEAHALLGQTLLRTSRFLLAVEHLQIAVSRHPEFGIVLAQIYLNSGNKEKGLQSAREAAARDRQLVLNEPADHLARLRWAEAARLLGSFGEAESILKDGALIHPGDDYRLALGQVYAAWAEAELAHRPPQLERGVVLVERALDCDPGNTTALSRLIELTYRSDKDAEPARKRLNEMLASGSATATLHMCLGVDAWRRNQLKEAEQHLSRAFALSPQLPQVANNLAWIMAHKEQPDLSRALEVIDAVLSKYPRNAHFRDTRGQILALQGKWKEAVDDLEAALPQLTSRKETHRALAESYKHLGLAELAQEHERRAALSVR